MGLLKKYYLFMGISLLAIPIVFLIINFSIFLCLFCIENILGYKINLNFKTSGLTIIFYILFFTVLLLLIIVASRYIYSIVKKLNSLDEKLQTIAYDKDLPEKLDLPPTKNDEINRVGHSINILIDRLRARELEIHESKVQENNYINQLSHDINTPLTALNLELYQLALRYQIDEKDIALSYEKISYISNLIKALPAKDDISNFYTC
ncbi:HAMP domain-containing protein [Staphylococcus croceilyticus]|uniref:histidine kinase n=2 Tax=Staphylococcus croceilyticus TaxID=319942 RepID=A0ABY2KIN6_9STAP|nr:HAMP domain-containing protein [Staphylococcus croceilyticus]TGA80385.1 HAMP domain-containing protein [Staphylococcus croceilyticus]